MTHTVSATNLIGDRPPGRGRRSRRLSARAVMRDEIDTARLARAFVELAIVFAEEEAAKRNPQACASGDRTELSVRPLTDERPVDKPRHPAA